MKHIEDLGISPLPWRVVYDIDDGVPFRIECTRPEGLSNRVLDDIDGLLESDARLLKSAPALYEELRQEMERRYCWKCKHAVWTERVGSGIEIMTGCDGKGTCPKPSWKKVLDEASGEVSNA